MEILLEVSAVHDTILNGVGTVNEELDLVLLAKLLHSLPFSLELLLSWLGPFLMGPLLRELDLKSAKPEIGPMILKDTEGSDVRVGIQPSSQQQPHTKSQIIRGLTRPTITFTNRHIL